MYVANAYYFCLIIKYAEYAQNLFHNFSNKITKIFNAHFWFLGHILQF